MPDLSPQIVYQCAFKNVILLSSCAYDLKEANEKKNRSKSKKGSEMSATDSSDKLDSVLTKMDAKMDDLLEARVEQGGKLNSILQKLENLETSQKQTEQSSNMGSKRRNKANKT